MSGGYGGGRANLVQATQHSVNTVYAQLAAQLGMNKVIGMARELGVSKTAVLPDVPSLVLGSGSVSVLDMASAYSTFADQGEHLSPIVVTRVERPDGSVVNFTPDRSRVLQPDQAARVTYCLQQVVQGGTGKDANFGIPEAGKTGTTTSNVDAWFVGYTPKLTAAVWMGYPDRNRSMDNVHGIQIQGGTLPAEMWRKFMQAVTANTDPGVFPDPGDISVGTRLNPGLSLVTTPPTTRPTPDHDAIEEAEAEEPEVDHHHHGAEEAEAQAQEPDHHDDCAEEAEAQAEAAEERDHGPEAEGLRPGRLSGRARSVGDDHLVGIVGATGVAPVLDVVGSVPLGLRRLHRLGTT